MKIIMIIGTRPQYIKVKPLYDYFKSAGIDGYLIDTNQHYSANVSTDLINELSLKIDKNLEIDASSEFLFMSDGIYLLHKQLSEICDEESVVLVFGDTNSTLIASLVAKKMGLKLAHVEAGIRCGDKNRPEELNRILVDELADIHFISRKRDENNVSNPIYIGDLEYSYLNSREDASDDTITYDDPILMTIHRQENVNEKRIREIFDFCRRLGHLIIFPIHHRTEKCRNDCGILPPNNVALVQPLSYEQIIALLKSCRGVISDSGGITKICPFFGKKCIIPLDKVEWSETILSGYATNQLDLTWFDDYKVDRDKEFYCVKNSCEIIVETLER